MVTATRPRIETGRNTVYSSGGVVVSISPLAASAGARVLADGGNAFDAAIATAAVEAVTVPPACGVGGEPFVIMYDAKTGQVHGMNGSGKAPMAANRDFFVKRGHKHMPLTGPLAAAIPGEILGWEQINERFGTRPLAKLIEPAIGYAEDGFAVSEQLGNGFKVLNDKLVAVPVLAGDIHAGRQPHSARRNTRAEEPRQDLEESRVRGRRGILQGRCRA